MGEVVIKNGGTGDTAFVDPNGRLSTTTVSEEIRDHAADTGIGQKFNINTYDITLSNATETSLLYIKNESTEGDLVVSALIYNLGNTTGGSGDVRIDVIRNPTAGDIITNGNNVTVGAGTEANQNFGSTNVLVGKFYKGASGETAFSDGDISISTRSAANTGRIVISLGQIAIPKGQSLGVNYLPPSGNTSQKVQIAAACYVKTKKVVGGAD
jgi:hypothetical protein